MKLALTGQSDGGKYIVVGDTDTGRTFCRVPFGPNDQDNAIAIVQAIEACQKLANTDRTGADFYLAHALAQNVVTALKGK